MGRMFRLCLWCAFLCAMAAPRSLAIVVPEQEPLNDSCFQPQVVECGTTIHPAAVDDCFDWDHFRFHVTAGTPITAITEDPGGFPYTDTTIEIFGGCNQMLAQDWSSGWGDYALIYRYVAPVTGDYVLRVHGRCTSHPQPYMATIYCGDLPAGACCLPAGDCQPLDRVQCLWQGGAYEGDGTVCGAVPCPAIPANDTCAQAIPISGPGQGVLEGDSFFARDDYDPWAPSCTGLPARGRDVVYRVDLDDGDVLDLRYTLVNGDGSIYVVEDCAHEGPSCVAGADRGDYQETESLVYVAGTPAPGACCFEGTGCSVLPEQECLREDGLWRGAWTDCDPNYCYEFMGACCTGDGGCFESSPWECEAYGGDYAGNGVLCYWQPCPRPPGACCLEGGACLLIEGQECVLQAGYWLGEGVPCDPNPCAGSFGACCYADDVCRIRLPDDCAAEGGAYQGDLVRCEETECGIELGACCLADGWCVVLSRTECDDVMGQWMGWDIPCDPNPCPALPAAPPADRGRDATTYYVILDGGVEDAGGPWRLEYSILHAAASPEVIATGALRVTVSPNPFRSSTRVLCFDRPERAPLRVEVFDAAGRLVRLLAPPEGGGRTWDGTDGRGRRAPAGAYFIRVWDEAGRAVTAPVILLE